jgi:hypothetical protein
MGRFTRRYGKVTEQCRKAQSSRGEFDRQKFVAFGFSPVNSSGVTFCQNGANPE